MHCSSSPSAAVSHEAWIPKAGRALHKHGSDLLSAAVSHDTWIPKAGRALHMHCSNVPQPFQMPLASGRFSNPRPQARPGRPGIVA